MPPDVHALAERLKRDYERFSPAQQSLTRYLADHLADVPLLSAHEVARASHCRPATVVRFAQALGYSGYPEMQRIVRRAQRPGLPPRPGDRQLGLPFSAEGLDAALAAERLGLDDAAERLTTSGLGAVVAALAPRTPLIIAGEGHARSVVTLIEERLARAGRPVAAVTSLDPSTRAWLDALGPGGGVLAIAIGRESRVAQAAVSAARAAGCRRPHSSIRASIPSRAALARVVPADFARRLPEPGGDGRGRPGPRRSPRAVAPRGRPGGCRSLSRPPGAPQVVR